jgi:hypothetical protein
MILIFGGYDEVAADNPCPCYDTVLNQCAPICGMKVGKSIKSGKDTLPAR